MPGGGFDDDQPLSDPERVAWARERIDECVNAQECSSIEYFPIQKPDGALAIVGCEVALEGQGDFGVGCFGVFRTPEEFCDFLLGSGYVAADDLGEISDDRILSHWDKSDRLR